MYNVMIQPKGWFSNQIETKGIAVHVYKRGDKLTTQHTGKEQTKCEQVEIGKSNETETLTKDNLRKATYGLINKGQQLINEREVYFTIYP